MMRARPYANRRGRGRRDRELHTVAEVERAAALVTPVSGDDECDRCGHPRDEHRTIAPHECVLGACGGCRCSGFVLCDVDESGVKHG